MMRTRPRSAWLVVAVVVTLAGGCADAPAEQAGPAETVTVTATSQTQKPVIAVGEPRLWVDEVTGAPGDGNRALTREIIRLIGDSGLMFARSPGTADYFVTAIVDVSVIDTQREIVEIVWRVTDRGGIEIGQISQRNEVPRGMLHREWGETAHFVALGGFEGVLAILDSLGHSLP